MQCTSCHNDSPRNATYCPFCGATTVYETSSKTVPGGVVVSELLADQSVHQAGLAEVDAGWDDLLRSTQTLKSRAISAPRPNHEIDEVQGNTLCGGFHAAQVVADDDLLEAAGQIVHETVIIDESLQRAPMNHTMIQQLVGGPSSDTAELLAVDDLEFGNRYGLKLLITAAVTAAVLGGIAIGDFIGGSIEAPTEARVAAAATDAVEDDAVAEVDRPRLRVEKGAEQTFDILRGAEVLHTVSTTRGSRYDDLADRERSIRVRLEHVQEKGEGLFTARIADDHYELVFNADGKDFRVLDVTKDDAKAVGTTPELLANLLADRLNSRVVLPNS